MRRFFDNERGQLLLITCLSVAIALVLVATYEYSTMSVNGNTIKRENVNSFYYYNNIRETYSGVYSDTNNVTAFENDLKSFALIHGYSVDFTCSHGNKTIIFIDTDIIIEEELAGGSC